MFVTYPDVLQPGRGGLRAGWPLALLAASGAAISHAIPSEQLACSYHFVSLSHSCLGIACGFGEGGAHRGCGWGWGGVWVQREGCIGGVSRCGWGSPGSGWGAAVAVGGGRLGAAEGALGAHRGVVGERLGVSGAQMGLKSYVFAGGKKFEGVSTTGQRVFLALLDVLGVTPA